MADRPSSKPEIGSQKRVIKLPPAVGDWTTYRPAPVLVKKIKSGLYGFDRLSREALNQVLLIHYRFTQELLKRLKIDLGLGVEFFSCQAEQTTYLNFLRTVSGAVVQGKLAVAGIHEGIQVFFDLNLANSIINHALGSRDLETLSRGLTEAESNVFSTALAEYLPKYTEAFANIFPLPAFSLVSSPDLTLDPSINPSSTFVTFSAEAALNENPAGKIIFGYPGNALKTLLKVFEEKAKNKPLNFNRLSAAVLSKILISASAVLGRTSLQTSELKLLEVGDVVSLDTPVNSPVNLLIRNLLKLPTQPGAINRKKAVRVAGFGEEEIRVAPPLEISEEKPQEKTPGIEALPAEEEEEILKEEDFTENLLEEEFPEDEALFEEEEEETKEE